ncbi:MAG: hypothetical protein WKG07_42180 [Hymenobacter sp.]
MEDEATLVFKLYGPRPNAIFRAAPGASAQLFHQRYATDADLAPAPTPSQPRRRQAAPGTGRPAGPLPARAARLRPGPGSTQASS